MTGDESVDALVVGGGFFGAAIACHLTRERGLRRVVVVEREANLLARASFANQARVHNGYHYPRSFTTAFRSRVNLPWFLRDYPDAVRRDFTKIYAIARTGSKVSARQFERFCLGIGAAIEPADPAICGLFDPHFVERVYRVEECAFDASRLREILTAGLVAAGVEARCGQRVTRIVPNSGRFDVSVASGDEVLRLMRAKLVFNCTYSGLNHLGFAGGVMARSGLKHEIAELALIRPPSALAGLGITVMDGPFFSLMPFPALGLHTLSHVRYTPHCDWADSPSVDPYVRLEEYHKETRVNRMLRDVVRWLPSMADAEPRGSLFEVKTVLTRNESDDGRPILFERHGEYPGLFSVLGGKIDNVYDILERLRAETL